MVRASSVDPEDARGAIALGLKTFEGGDYAGALALFDKSLGLPGTGTWIMLTMGMHMDDGHTSRFIGVKRFRDKPPQISDGEKQAAYFNIACCQSKLGNVKDGLIAVAGCIEAGYAVVHAQGGLHIPTTTGTQTLRSCALILIWRSCGQTPSLRVFWRGLRRNGQDLVHFLKVFCSKHSDAHWLTYMGWFRHCVHKPLQAAIKCGQTH